MDFIFFISIASVSIASFVLSPIEKHDIEDEERDKFNLVLDELLQENIHGIPSQVVRSIKRRTI